MNIGALFKKGLRLSKSLGKTVKKGAMHSFTAGPAPRTFNVAQKASYYFKHDVGVKMGKTVATGIKKGSKWTSTPFIKPMNRVHRLGHGLIRNEGVRTAGRWLGRSTFTVGATAMMGLSLMKGGMDAAKDIVHERYMQDYTYSRSVLHNSRVGLASGTNRMLERSGVQGLTNALHKTRHGRY